MQTFLPYKLFQESAQVLDNQRLGKQRVECLQILDALKKGPFQKKQTIIHNWESCSEQEYNSLPKINTRKTPWYNHPAAKMWRGYEKSLAIYGLYICNEWVKRGFNDSCFKKFQEIIPNYVFTEDNYIDYSGYSARHYLSPQWLGDEKFHSSHRSNLLRKDSVWYGKFGWTEPHDLPYIWPS